MTHTPGPWQIAHKEDSAHYRFARVTIVDAGDKMVCIIPNNREITEAMENAMAIIAAPDLLAALKDILSPSVIERLEYDDDCIAVSVPNGALTCARAAIARAEGGANMPDEEADANAAFIVRVVNAHAALLAALEAVEWVHDGRHLRCPSCGVWRRDGPSHAPNCQLAAAIAEAEGAREERAGPFPPPTGVQPR